MSEMVGVQDWDFVSMDDYRHDMKEASDTASGIIRRLRDDRDGYRLMVGVLVLAAGGRIAVPSRLFSDPSVVMECWEDLANDQRVYTARHASLHEGEAER